MIVVTGASGFIGGALCASLSRAGVPHRAVSRTDLDLSDAAAVRRLLEATSPRVVVHLAGSVGKGEDERARAAQWRDTFHAGVTLVGEAEAASVPRLIIAGSIDELGPAEGVLGVATPADPRSTYGLCKDLLRRVSEHAARRSAIAIDWMRPFVVYGPGQTGSMLIPYAFDAASNGREGEFSDGLQTRDLLYIDDLVSWCLRALAPDRLPARGCAIHHLGRGEGVRIRDVVTAVAEEFPAARFSFGRRSRRAGEPDVQCAPPVSEATTVAGWQPEVRWRDGVARTAAWWRTRATAPVSDQA